MTNPLRCVVWEGKMGSIHSVVRKIGYFDSPREADLKMKELYENEPPQSLDNIYLRDFTSRVSHNPALKEIDQKEVRSRQDHLEEIIRLIDAYNVHCKGLSNITYTVNF
jgi:hypothetical protein